MINCLGYATGHGCAVEPHRSFGLRRPGQSLQKLMEELGFTCTEWSKKPSKSCQCNCDQNMLMLYIYKYSLNPNNRDPWTYPWIFAPQQDMLPNSIDGKKTVSPNDYHAIKCDQSPTKKKKNGVYKCSKGWSYVPTYRDHPRSWRQFKNSSKSGSVKDWKRKKLNIHSGATKLPNGNLAQTWIQANTFQLKDADDHTDFGTAKWQKNEKFCCCK